MRKITNSAVIDAARAVLDAHIVALNASDEDALVATLYFPNYMLTGGALKSGTQLMTTSTISVPELAVIGIIQVLMKSPSFMQAPRKCTWTCA